MIVDENSDKLINKHPGGCVCGSLKYEVSGEPERIIVCHCQFCQRRTGSAFAIIPMFEKKHVLFNEGEKKVFRSFPNEYGRWIDLQFCPNCGANVGFTLELLPELQAIDAGTLDNSEWLDPENPKLKHIFTEAACHLNKQGWLDLPD